MNAKARLHTRACDLLGGRHPILQADMGGAARPELVAAVTAAGGYGVLDMMRESPALSARTDIVDSALSTPSCLRGDVVSGECLT